MPYSCKGICIQSGMGGHKRYMYSQGYVYCKVCEKIYIPAYAYEIGPRCICCKSRVRQTPARQRPYQKPEYVRIE